MQISHRLLNGAVVVPSKSGARVIVLTGFSMRRHR